MASLTMADHQRLNVSGIGDAFLAFAWHIGAIQFFPDIVFASGCKDGKNEHAMDEWQVVDDSEAFHEAVVLQCTMSREHVVGRPPLLVSYV